MIFHHGKPLRLRNAEALRGLTSNMACLLPPERLNAFLRDLDSHPLYPSFQCDKEEIGWHFHRLKPAA